MGGTLNADVGTDGLYAANSEDSEKGTVTIEGGILNLLCQKDGVDASGDIRIDGGTLTISAGSNQEGKGIKSDADITVSGGCVTVSSVDDAIHASGSVELSGGDLLLSTGDDGVHADDTLAVSGGCVTVNQSYEGMEAQVILGQPLRRALLAKAGCDRDVGLVVGQDAGKGIILRRVFVDLVDDAGHAADDVAQLDDLGSQFCHGSLSFKD